MPESAAGNLIAPKVSIGLPVLNGSRYISEAIESILAQTYRDFELIISDNHSDDDTFEICSDYARRDNRIRLYRNERDLGVAPNLNRLFRLSRGEYFKWAYYDDILSPRFIEATIGVLEQDPAVLLCMTRTNIIDQDGTPTRPVDIEPFWDSNAVDERLLGALRDPSRLPVHGLFRASSLRRTVLHGSYADSDGNLIVELALQGRIAIVDEVLYGLRVHPLKSTVRMTKPRDRQAFFDTSRPLVGAVPTLAALFEHLRSIRRHTASIGLRLRLYPIVLNWYLRNRRGLLRSDARLLLERVVSRNRNQART